MSRHLSLRLFIGLVLCLGLVHSQISLSAAEPTAATEQAPDTWVTSIATQRPVADAGHQCVHFGGIASGLLLRPSDVVMWTDDNFANRTTVMTHPAAVWSVRVCDDGKHIASVDYRGNLQTYDTETKQATMYEGAFERWAQTMKFVPGEETILAGNEAGKLFVWKDGKVEKSVDVDKSAITDFAFNSAKDKLAITDGAGTVHWYSWPALESVGKTKVSEEAAWCVRFVADTNAVLVGAGDRKLYRCEAASDQAPQVVLEGKDWITRLAVSESGLIAAGELSGAVHVLSKDGQKGKDSPAASAPSSIWALEWDGTDTLLVGTRRNGVVEITQNWQIETPAPAEPAAAETETKPAETEPAETKPATDAPVVEAAAAEAAAAAPPQDAAPAEKAE